jgi:hypothetical protein
MAVNLSPVGGVAVQFFTNDGTILSGGKIYTYTAGTNTPQVTYTTSAGTIAHSNPIILDSAGRVPTGEIWLTDGLVYKFVIKDANDVLIGTYDNIVGINSNFINFTNQQEIQTATAGQTVFTLTTMQYQPGTGSLSVFVDGVNQYGPSASYAFTETSSTVVTFVSGLHVGASVKFTTSEINAASYGDAFQISYTPPFTASVATNVGDKLAQTISPEDFGAVGDGTTDDTVAMQAAIDQVQSNGGGTIILTGGKNYKISNAPLTISQQNVAITSEGSLIGATITVANDAAGIELTAARATFKGFSLVFSGASGSATSHGIDASTVQTPYVNMENVTIQGFPGDGVKFFDVFASRFSNCHFFENDGYGFNALAGTSLDLSSCYARANLTGGYRLSTVAYSTLNACAADDNEAPAYSLVQCYSIAMDGCGSETTLPNGAFSVIEIEGSIACSVRNYFSSTDLVGAGAGDSLIRIRDGVSRNADLNSFSNIQLTSIQVDYTIDVNTTLDCSTFIVGDIAGALVATVLDAGNKVGNIKGQADIKFFKANRTKAFWYDVANDLLNVGVDVEVGPATTDSGATINAAGILSVRRHNSTSQVARFYGTGETRISGDGSALNTTGTWGTISDRRLKENIAYISDDDALAQVEDVKALKFARYNIIGNDKTFLGLIAQDVQETSPNLVEADEEGMLSVKQSIVHQKAVIALQHALKRIEILEAKTAHL